MVQSHWKHWGQISGLRNSFRNNDSFPSSFLFEDEMLYAGFQMLMNKWITQDFPDTACLGMESVILHFYRLPGDADDINLGTTGPMSDTFLLRVKLKEQLKLKNLATSSHNKTSIWCRASFSNHRTLGRIHGVSGREHVMGKKKFLDPSGLSSQLKLNDNVSNM